MPYFKADGTPWYGYKGAIRSVVIGEGITTVGRCAFHSCRALVEVTLPSTLETIVEYAFYNCINLPEITIPASVTRIEIFSFRKCFKLTNMTFETAYGWSADGKAFSKAEMLSGAADYLVTGNYKNTWTRDVNAEDEIIDPNYVTGGMCGYNAKWTLTYIDEAKTKMKLTITGYGDMTAYRPAGAPWYEYLDSIVEIEVGEGITSIGKCAFYNLKMVRKVTLYEGLVSIGDYAFNTCRLLKEITVPTTVTYIGIDAFAKTGLAEIPTV